MTATDMLMASFAKQGFVAGPFALSRGPKNLKPGEGSRIADYTPPVVFPTPTDGTTTRRELLDGTKLLYGTPLLFSTQIMYAVAHGMQSIGFGESVVTFTCHWSWAESSDVTVAEDGSYLIPANVRLKEFGG